MSEPTPTPWRIDGYKTRPTTEPYGALIVSDRGDGFHFRVALCAKHPGINTETSKANAALIVKCVNAHDALVTELKLIVDWCNVSLAGEYEHSLRDIIRSMLDCADRALETIKVPA